MQPQLPEEGQGVPKERYPAEMQTCSIPIPGCSQCAARNPRPPSRVGGPLGKHQSGPETRPMSTGLAGLQHPFRRAGSGTSRLEAHWPKYVRTGSELSQTWLQSPVDTRGRDHRQTCTSVGSESPAPCPAMPVNNRMGSRDARIMTALEVWQEGMPLLKSPRLEPRRSSYHSDTVCSKLMQACARFRFLSIRPVSSKPKSIQQSKPKIPSAHRRVLRNEYSPRRYRHG
jgi:hypothetical protein